MRIAFVSSPAFRNKWLVNSVYDKIVHSHFDIVLVPSPVAGAIRWVVDCSRIRRVPIEIIPVRYPELKESLCLRNSELVREADGVIAFWTREQDIETDTVYHAIRVAKLLNRRLLIVNEDGQILYSTSREIDLVFDDE